MRTSLFLALFMSSIYCWGTDVDSALVAEAGLPVVYINTVTGQKPTFEVAPKKKDYIGNTITNNEKVPGRLYVQLNGETIYDSDEYVKDTTGITIKVRGNTSALVVDKWGYKIKLQKKADLLFRNNDSIYSDKDWIIVFDDNMKNMYGLKVNELMKMQWTPGFSYVNVVMNGTYEGVYMLMESVKRKPKCRLDVSKSGYIVEFDPYWWNEEVYVESSLPWIPWLHMHYTFKYPDQKDITKEQLDYFKGYVDKVEESLRDGTYPKYIDVESFARWMLARDILGNSDGAGSNIFFTKYDDTDDSKLVMANLWDLEGATRNKGRWDEVHNLGVFYYHDLFDSDNEDFKKAYKWIWNHESDALFSEIQAYLDNYSQSEEAVAMNRSLELDAIRWDHRRDDVPTCIAKAKQWFSERKEWMTTAISKIATGIKERTVNDSADGNDATYYNLNGQIVADPGKGIYIIRKDGKTIKVHR